jgi:hypothetical protein
MIAIVLVVTVATVFVLGVLIGQQWNRRALNSRGRELASARRERDELARVLGLRRR